MTPSPPGQPDPLLRHARREAVAVFLIWLAALCYTVGYCYLYGYERKIEDLKFVLGIPDWVFWGIITPWAVCTVVSCLFSLFVMRDDDLGEEWNPSLDPEHHHPEERVHE